MQLRKIYNKRIKTQNKLRIERSLRKTNIYQKSKQTDKQAKRKLQKHKQQMYKTDDIKEKKNKLEEKQLQILVVIRLE